MQIPTSTIRIKKRQFWKALGWRSTRCDLTADIRWNAIQSLWSGGFAPTTNTVKPCDPARATLDGLEPDTGLDGTDER